MNQQQRGTRLVGVTRMSSPCTAKQLESPWCRHGVCAYHQQAFGVAGLQLIRSTIMCW